MKVLLICSHGGHLAQMKEIATKLRDHEVCWVSYHGAQLPAGSRRYLLTNFGRNPLRYAAGIVSARNILRREEPDVIISTGSEIAIPFFLIAGRNIHKIYIESLSRVFTPSVTGRIVVRVADEFFVQWPTLLSFYGDRAQYRGSIL